MATLYFNAAVDNDWNTLGNWWTVSPGGTPAVGLPVAADSVEIHAVCSSNTGGAITVTNMLVKATQNIGITMAVTGTATFEDGAFWSGGTLTGAAVFSGVGSNHNSGTIVGDPVFSGSGSFSNDAITGNATFSGQDSYSLGTVSGNVTLSGVGSHCRAGFSCGGNMDITWTGTLTTSEVNPFIPAAGTTTFTQDISIVFTSGSPFIDTANYTMGVGALLSITCQSGTAFIGTLNETKVDTVVFEDGSSNGGSVGAATSVVFQGSAANSLGATVSYTPLVTFDTGFNDGTIDNVATLQFNGASSYNGATGVISNTTDVELAGVGSYNAGAITATTVTFSGNASYHYSGQITGSAVYTGPNSYMDCGNGATVVGTVDYQWSGTWALPILSPFQTASASGGMTISGDIVVQVSPQFDSDMTGLSVTGSVEFQFQTNAFNNGTIVTGSDVTFGDGAYNGNGKTIDCSNAANVVFSGTNSYNDGSIISAVDVHFSGAGSYNDGSIISAVDVHFSGAGSYQTATGTISASGTVYVSGQNAYVASGITASSCLFTGSGTGAYQAVFNGCSVIANAPAQFTFDRVDLQNGSTMTFKNRESLVSAIQTQGVSNAAMFTTDPGTVKLPFADILGTGLL
jgi:hypothetical protein